MRAPTNSEGRGRDLSLAVANRSAALMKLGYHEAALQDVELALNSGYPQDLKYKTQPIRTEKHKQSNIQIITEVIILD